MPVPSGYNTRDKRPEPHNYPQTPPAPQQSSSPAELAVNSLSSAAAWECRKEEPKGALAQLCYFTSCPSTNTWAVPKGTCISLGNCWAGF